MIPNVKRSSYVSFGLVVAILGAALLVASYFFPLYSHIVFAIFYFAAVLTVSLVFKRLLERVRRAEISSHDSEEQLAATREKSQFHVNLLNVVEQAIVSTDMDGRVVYWNKFAEKLYGWTSEEVMGRNITDFIASDLSRDQADEIMSQLKAGESWSGEFLAQHRDGSVIPVRVRDSPVYDGNGKQIGIVGGSEDISRRIRSDREKARLTLAIEEQRLRLDNIVASVPGVVWEAVGEPDAGSQSIDFVSEYVETMLGYKVAEWLSTPNFWLQIVHDDDKERAGREAAAIYATGSGTSQFRWVAKDGHVLWVESQSIVIYDDDGRAIGMRGVTMDITERVRAAEIHSRLAAIVESSGDAIIGKTLDGIITSWNDGAGRIYGYNAGEVIGKSISIIIPPERASELPELLEKLKSDMQIEQFETVRLRKNGTRVDVAITLSPIHDPNGKVIGASAIAHDITERKLVEVKQAELLALERAARSQAESANRTKDEFLATLSHELRTPLTAILGWTWMLRYRSLDDDTYTRAVETIDRNVNMQAHLIDDLLDVSRIIKGNLRLEVSPVDLVAVIDAAVDTVRPAAMAKEINLELDLDHSAKHVVCDPARIQQVAWNLLSNAVKFTRKCGTVRVQLKRLPDQIEFSVSDTGRGIGAEFLPYVFDRFRQADGSTTRTHGGLGLGLAIVRHLIELHGGTVRVESAGVEMGARFIVSMPLILLPIEQQSTFP